MGLDEARIHIAWMARRIADAGDARHLGDARDQLGKRSEGAFRRSAMIGIDVLADQAHLADTRGGPHFDFRNDAFDRPRGFRAARVRHHAERAEFITAFLHGYESADATLANLAR